MSVNYRLGIDLDGSKIKIAALDEPANIHIRRGSASGVCGAAWLRPLPGQARP
ncbi:MAG: hypothetical protein HC808_02900 [Candidatus Competibacteraceae bacterium]|nr:hypothetical protein [Candidatus Competibacteraceae bacterium]